jgi:hypothetical protein
MGKILPIYLLVINIKFRFSREVYHLPNDREVVDYNGEATFSIKLTALI